MTQTKNPKILVVTIPIRPIPTEYPPTGSLSVINALKKAGFHDTEFYNIDFLRPSFPNVLNHIQTLKPDILGISAVVSTAYGYTKRLSLEIKKILPETFILLGGNLGASAEIILKKTGVDFICISEGERTAVDFASCWRTKQSKNDFSNVQGLAFLDNAENLIVTPFAASLKPEEIYDIDWSLLISCSDQYDFFFPLKEVANVTRASFSNELRLYETHRHGKRVASVSASKGCVARCTFCHRWDKGIRYIPVPILMRRIDHLINSYDVGFISFSDENFGTDRKWLALFIKEIAKRDVLWRVSGMRVNTINPDLIKQMKEAGCSCIYYGMESGSQKILNVMEKVTKVEQNYNAVKWMAENDLHTIVQIVIGMPGETSETIAETAQFTSYFVEQSPDTDPNALSINFAQALPGTPLYETARHKGDIGQSLEDEEKYLIQISDRDARDGKTYINLTDYPKLLLEKWNFDIQNKTRHAYIKKWGLDNYYKIILKSERYKNLKEVQETHNPMDTGYFADPARQSTGFATGSSLPTPPASRDVVDAHHDVSKKIQPDKGGIPSLWSLFRKKSLGALSTFYPNFFWRTRSLATLFVFGNCIRKYGLKYSMALLFEYLGWWLVSMFKNTNGSNLIEYISLRKLLRKKIFPAISIDNPSMDVLRKGR